MKNIYLITNKINGKKYVGKTKQDIKERFKEHIWCNYNTLIHLAIKKYGQENFSIELIERVLDKEALKKEKEYIIKFNTLSPMGYNSMLGQSLQGGNNKMKGKKLPKKWSEKTARIGVQNGRACLFELTYLKTGEKMFFETRKDLSTYLNCSIASIKKWMGKKHIDHVTKEIIIFKNIGRIREMYKQINNYVYNKLLIDDAEIAELIKKEDDRLDKNIELIASENFPSEAVRAAMASSLVCKYSEGYPGNRYYGGCENIDAIESLCKKRWQEVFNTDYHVNVQPHSGSSANLAAYMAVLNVGDTILAMNLNNGG